MNGYLSLDISEIDIPVIDSPLITRGVITSPVINSRLNGGIRNNLNNINHKPSLDCEYYATMDLCSQAQIYEDADNILSRMDKLRAFATKQRAKRVKPQRQQASFSF